MVLTFPERSGGTHRTFFPEPVQNHDIQEMTHDIHPSGPRNNPWRNHSQPEARLAESNVPNSSPPGGRYSSPAPQPPPWHPFFMSHPRSHSYKRTSTTVSGSDTFLLTNAEVCCNAP